VSRRIMPDDMLPSDMEVAASEEALSRAGIGARTDRSPHDQRGRAGLHRTPNACAVHFKLGLPSNCFSTVLDTECSGFLQQLVLAQTMIAAGRARYALLTQANVATRLIPSAAPSSAWFGDGATAVVVGPVADGRGILSTSHRDGWLGIRCAGV